MADKAHIQTDILLAEMEKRLSAIYKTATDEIQAKADAYFQKFKKQDEAQKQLVENGEISQEEYISWRKNKIMQGEDWKKIRSQLVLEYENINKTALAYINDKLPEIYALNYNAFEDVASDIKGYSFTLLDQNAVKNLVLNDKTLLPAKVVNTRRYERWCTQKINAQILQGILQGESMPKMAKRLQRVSEMDKNSAIRNARTMTTSAENKGRIDSYKKAQEDGIVLQKEWIATFDGRTRHSHAMVDGELREQEELFSNGLLYPGDPNGAPVEVYNCRCSLGSKVIGFDDRLFAEHLDREDRQNVSEWQENNKDSSINSLTNNANRFIMKESNKKQIVATEIAEVSLNSIPKIDSAEVFKKAKQGIKHSGIYKDAIKKTEARLKKSIKSHEQQIEIHIEKLKNPEKFDAEWDKKTEQQRKGLLKKWLKDIQRNSEQAEIERRVWDERFGK